jgi:hypothetical protein
MPRSRRGGFFVFFSSLKQLVALYGAYSRDLMGSPTKGNPTSSTGRYPHLESPQLRQVMQPSIITTAAVEHLAQSCAPSGK